MTQRFVPVVKLACDVTASCHCTRPGSTLCHCLQFAFSPRVSASQLVVQSVTA